MRHRTETLVQERSQASRLIAERIGLLSKAAGP
jgi:hypothetical protein